MLLPLPRLRTRFTACCRYVWTSGDAYSGDWRSGRRHGLGTFRSSNGAVYIGQWRRDLRWGRCEGFTLWSLSAAQVARGCAPSFAF